MDVDDPANDIQLSGVEAVATGQFDRFEPKLAGAVLSLDVHVRRLITVEAGEEDPVRPRDALDSWHSEMSALRRALQAIVSEPRVLLAKDKSAERAHHLRAARRPVGWMRKLGRAIARRGLKARKASILGNVSRGSNGHGDHQERLCVIG